MNIINKNMRNVKTPLALLTASKRKQMMRSQTIGKVREEEAEEEEGSALLKFKDPTT